MSTRLRTAREWYEEAARFYIEAHQGCAWCHGENQVYRSVRDHLVEFRCGGCEFYVSHDRRFDEYHMTAGDTRADRVAPPTMLAIELG